MAAWFRREVICPRLVGDVCCDGNQRAGTFDADRKRHPAGDQGQFNTCGLVAGTGRTAPPQSALASPAPPGTPRPRRT